MRQILNLRPSEEDILKIRRKLQDYNSNFFEIRDEPQFTISEIDKYNELVGGIVCTIVGQWLEVDFLWVRDEQRGKGLGKKLLHEAERIAMGNKCKKAFLTTMNFQAQPFYLKYGYKTVYVQREYPITNEKYFMEKELNKNV
ncbi:GNAT family N-acetyltransferase [Clostridium aciditolerans]|uniref:GNAT family N-acetyltransferase n=1 Tax=Clostridium aciditolerans TaxID=339861 RepID=A0A934M4X5_9CLOT|nr:GNAT family N-acetyltransferase [Clostridium aciditolerans]MBI6874485.1 GNAT family N-acetyltransferase [Clostridium aciditolerans]